MKYTNFDLDVGDFILINSGKINVKAKLNSNLLKIWAMCCKKLNY